MKHLAVIVLWSMFSSFGLVPTISAQSARPEEVPTGLEEAGRRLAAPAGGDSCRIGRRLGIWEVDNPDRGIRAALSSQEVTVASPHGMDGGLELRLDGWGRGDAIRPVASAIEEQAGRRISFRRGPIVEWYENGALGLQQGFTIASPPPGDATPREDPLHVVLAFDGDFAAEARLDARGVRFRSADGGSTIHYEGLLAWDAEGDELEARLAVEGRRISILVDDRDASYPVTIDPWIWSEQTRLIASDGEHHDNLGWSTAIDGDTVLAGAWADDDLAFTSGATYVFVRSGTTWTEQVKLTASDGSADDLFGWDVAVDGDTAVIAASGDYHAGWYAGSAYVFVRNGTSWTEQAKLLLDNGVSSVDISGETIVIGSAYDDPGGVQDEGSASVFVRSGTTWSQQAQLVTGAGANHHAGAEVEIDGDRVLVGGYGGAHVFDRSGTTWTLQDTFWACCTVYETPIGLSGDTVVLGGDLTGSAYVYFHDGASWSPQALLEASDDYAGNDFGYEVAIDGNTILVTAYWAPVCDDKFWQAVYVFTRRGSEWTEQAKIAPFCGPYEGHEFGLELQLDDGTALMGEAMGCTTSWSFRPGLVFVYTSEALAHAVFRNDAGGTNPTGFAAGAPVLSETWIASVNNTGTGNFVAGVQGFEDPLELYMPGAAGYLLVDPRSTGGELTGLPPAFGYGVVTFDVPLPPDPALVGFSFSTQGAGFGGAGGTTLHNAYDLFVGQ